MRVSMREPKDRPLRQSQWVKRPLIGLPIVSHRRESAQWRSRGTSGQSGILRNAGVVFALAALLACRFRRHRRSRRRVPGNPARSASAAPSWSTRSEHPLLGSMQYRKSLPLNDKEVVLTFDDGPLPPYTNRILDTLASECVKATFFMVGRMVRGYPTLVRRIYNDGHTVANHSQNHPFTFHKMSRRAGRARDRGRLRLAARGARRSEGGRAVLPHSRPAARRLGRAISCCRATS